MTDIPSIVVENMPETPLMSSSDTASAGLESSPSPSDSKFRDLDNGRSMSVDLTSGSRLQRSGHARPVIIARFRWICPKRRKQT
jgi:voltage-dependent calcium channel